MEASLADCAVLRTAGIPVHLATQRELDLVRDILQYTANIELAANELLRRMGFKEIA